MRTFLYWKLWFHFLFNPSLCLYFWRKDMAKNLMKLNTGVNFTNRFVQCEKHMGQKMQLCFSKICIDTLKQRSQTRGPREGRMRPANIGKNEDFKENIKPICLFFKTIEFLNYIFFFIFLMRPARPYFQSHAARETLWVWDPCFKAYFRMLVLHAFLINTFAAEIICTKETQLWHKYIGEINLLRSISSTFFARILRTKVRLKPNSR